MRKIVDIYQLQPVDPRRKVGIEIEVEGARLIGNPIPYWRAVNDGSLRGESQEYIFKNPQPYHRVPVLLNILKDKMEKNKSIIIPSERCGLHVHINVQQMTEQQVLNYATLYLLFEDLMVNYCGEDREGNFFCLRVRDAEYLLQGMISAQRLCSLFNLQHDNFRYASINLSAIQKYGSVEFRALRTPKDFLKAIPWVEMLLLLYKNSLQFSHPRKIVEQFSQLGPKEFLNKTLEQHSKLFNNKRLEQTLFEGIRRIQDIAYVVGVIQNDSVFIPV